MANVRIKDLTTDSALAAGDYVVIDSASEGSRKFDLGTELANLKEDIEQLDGLSDDAKTALLAIAQNVVYKNDDADYYQNLYDALYPPAQTYTVTNTLTGCTTNNAAASVTENTPYSATITASSGYTLTGATVSITMGGTDITATAYNNGAISIASVTGNLGITVTATAITLSSISAVYTQSGTVYDTDTLNSLKTDLVVTATWSDTSTSTVASTDYTLSGTLTAGTSTITVTYLGKTTTFTVNVTAVPLYQLANGTHNYTRSNYNGYVTISNHNHVTFDRTNAPSSGGGANYLCLSDLDYNGTDVGQASNINNHSSIFTLQNGDEVRIVVSNVSGSFDDYTIGLRKASGTTSVAAVSGQTTDSDTSVTVSADSGVGCLFMYIGTATAATKDFEADVAVYVNDVQYF